MIYFLLLPLLFFLLIIFVGWYLSEPGYHGPKSDHFSGRKFFLPQGHKINGYKEIIKLMWTMRPPFWIKNYESYAHNEQITRLPKETNRIYHINHSSFLIQMNGLNILIDPVWSEYCSPVPFAGPQRQRPPGIPFDFLPPIDLVLISHNHYDHLDIPTIKRLIEEYDPTIIVPLGVSRMKALRNHSKIQEIDWHESQRYGDLIITGTPAIHYGARGMFDRAKTLWCGFLIKGNKTVYYTGDTAYESQIFKSIGQQIKIDLALIPIGAYLPRWFMKLVHINPEEAVQIHKDLNSPQSMACHFGTFPLAGDGQGQAEGDLRKALVKHGIQASNFVIPDEGIPYPF